MSHGRVRAGCVAGKYRVHDGAGRGGNRVCMVRKMKVIIRAGAGGGISATAGSGIKEPAGRICRGTIDRVMLAS